MYLSWQPTLENRLNTLTTSFLFLITSFPGSAVGLVLIIAIIYLLIDSNRKQRIIEEALETTAIYSSVHNINRGNSFEKNSK